MLIQEGGACAVFHQIFKSFWNVSWLLQIRPQPDRLRRPAFNPLCCHFRHRERKKERKKKSGNRLECLALWGKKKKRGQRDKRSRSEYILHNLSYMCSVGRWEKTNGWWWCRAETVCFVKPSLGHRRARRGKKNSWFVLGQPGCVRFVGFFLPFKSKWNCSCGSSPRKKIK